MLTQSGWSSVYLTSSTFVSHVLQGDFCEVAGNAKTTIIHYLTGIELCQSYHQLPVLDDGEEQSNGQVSPYCC